MNDAYGGKTKILQGWRVMDIKGMTTGISLFLTGSLSLSISSHPFLNMPETTLKLIKRAWVNDVDKTANDRSVFRLKLNVGCVGHFSFNIL